MEPTEIIASAASPFIFAFCPVFRRRIALIIVTGITMRRLLLTDKTAATAIAPKATWESPSPMNE